MASKRRQRARRPGRRPPSRSPRRRLLAVCEGKVTEPAYIKGFEREARNASVTVEIPDQQGTPRTLVEVAKDLRYEAARQAKRLGDDFLAFDEVWCVFDRDEHPRFHDACQMAKDNGIALAVSNPCFELWLLLHFRENPGMQHRYDVQRMLRAFLPGYDKHLEFSSVAGGVADAATRAMRLDADAEAVNEAGRNPTTGVYRLTGSIARKGD